MMRFVVILALALALAGVLANRGEVTRLTRLVESYEARIAMLEQEAVRNRAAQAVLSKFSLASYEQLKKMDRRRVVTVTAYSPRPEETDTTPFHTATNTRVRSGIVAVSRDLFDDGWVFGKRVYIKGLGVFVIDDLMAEKKSRHIDIFMGDPKTALSFGVKKLEAYLLDA